MLSWAMAAMRARMRRQAVPVVLLSSAAGLLMPAAQVAFAASETATSPVSSCRSGRPPRRVARTNTRKPALHYRSRLIQQPAETKFGGSHARACSPSLTTAL
jgi:hypothetical protein